MPLWVAYYRRAQPKFLAVRDLLAAGEIGDVRFARILLQRVPVAAEADPATRTWRFAPAVSGGGHLLDMGSHMLDLLDFFLGPVRAAQGIAVNQTGLYPAEDSVVANLAFDRGVLGVGVWNSASHAPADVIELVGDRGELRFACFDPSPITSGPRGASPGDRGRAPGARPAAAHPDDCGRAKRERPVPEHRRERRAHDAGHRRDPCQLPRRRGDAGSIVRPE